MKHYAFLIFICSTAAYVHSSEAKTMEDIHQNLRLLEKLVSSQQERINHLEKLLKETTCGNVHPSKDIDEMLEEEVKIRNKTPLFLTISRLYGIRNSPSIIEDLMYILIDSVNSITFLFLEIQEGVANHVFESAEKQMKIIAAGNQENDAKRKNVARMCLRHMSGCLKYVKRIDRDRPLKKSEWSNAKPLYHQKLLQMVEQEMVNVDS